MLHMRNEPPEFRLSEGRLESSANAPTPVHCSLSHPFSPRLERRAWLLTRGDGGGEGGPELAHSVKGPVWFSPK